MSDTEDLDGPNPGLPLAEIELIQPFLNEFKSAKRGQRKHMVRKGVTAIMASRDISQLRPLAQGKMIAQVREVGVKRLTN